MFVYGHRVEYYNIIYIFLDKAANACTHELVGLLLLADCVYVMLRVRVVCISIIIFHRVFGAHAGLVWLCLAFGGGCAI